MKKWFLHILLLAGLFGMLTTSCSQDEVLEEVVEKEKVVLRFTIAMDEPNTISRATWEGYDPNDNDYSEEDTDGNGIYKQRGTAIENYIDPTRTHVVAYSANGELMGVMRSVNVQPKAGDDHVYTLTGTLEVESTKAQAMVFKLMVFANCTLPANLNNLNNIHFVMPTATNGSGIPMWGIATFGTPSAPVNLTTGTELNPCDLGDIFMLRSMAKIEVELSDDMYETYNLAGIVPNKYHSNGYVMPTLKKSSTDYSVATLSNTKILGTEEVFHPYGEAIVNPTTNGIAFFDANANIDGADQNKKWVIYMPEYQYIQANGELSFNLALQTKNGIPVYKSGTTQYSFKHGLYSGGSYQSNPWNVVRNHYYKYVISGINNGGELTLNCIVMDWTDDLEIHDFAVSVLHTGVITPVEGQYQDASPGRAIMKEIELSNGDKIKLAQVTFTIASPRGYTWYASLVSDDEGKAFAFANMVGGELEMNGNELVTNAIASGPVGTTATLTIVSEHTGLLNPISSRIQMIVRNDITGDTYRVQDNILTGIPGNTGYVIEQKN